MKHVLYIVYIKWSLFCFILKFNNYVSNVDVCFEVVDIGRNFEFFSKKLISFIVGCILVEVLLGDLLIIDWDALCLGVVFVEKL